jgi:hypothetical protein
MRAIKVYATDFPLFIRHIPVKSNNWRSDKEIIHSPEQLQKGANFRIIRRKHVSEEVLGSFNRQPEDDVVIEQQQGDSRDEDTDPL